MFNLMHLFWSRIPFRTPHSIQSSSPLGLPLAVTVPQTVFDFDDTLGEYWSGILQKFLNWDSSAIFLMIRLGLWVFVRKTTEVTHPSQHIKSRVVLPMLLSAVGVSPDHPAGIVFVWFLHFFLSFFSPSTLHSLKGSHRISFLGLPNKVPLTDSLTHQKGIVPSF